MSPADHRPILATAVPGPASRALARRLARVESPNLTFIADDWPVFLDRGDGAFVFDVDGNRLLDMTGCFAVAALGHGPTAATAAGAEQLARLAHGMGDVHPTAAKVELLERIARIAPFPNAKTILGCNGADAVEAALKTARLTTGRPGVISFSNGYHGLSYGALAATQWAKFRDPLAGQTPRWSELAVFPDPYRLGPRAADLAIDSVQRILDSQAGPTIGAVIVEPIQGRGGDVVPPDDFLPRLRTLCEDCNFLLIFDEIYCGLGRAGSLLACSQWNVAPDVLLLGKALGGGFPISACVCSEPATAGWPTSTGEAIHTYTFLGHPVGCAMGCASLDRLIADELPARADRLGQHLRARLRETIAGHPNVGEIRGRGLMNGIELVADRERKQPAGELAVSVMKRCLSAGLLLLASGVAGNVLSLSPPLTVSEAQLDAAAEIIANALGGHGA